MGGAGEVLFTPTLGSIGKYAFGDSQNFFAIINFAKNKTCPIAKHKLSLF